MRSLVAILLASVVVSGAAHADDKTSAGHGRGQARAPLVFDFEDDRVEGDMRRPDGDLVQVIQKAGHASLIEVRQDFLPELVKSFENL
jgi:hypothetical protein